MVNMWNELTNSSIEKCLLCMSLCRFCVFFYLHVWQGAVAPVTAVPANHPLALTPVLWSATIRAALRWANSDHLGIKSPPSTHRNDHPYHYQLNEGLPFPLNSICLLIRCPCPGNGACVYSSCLTLHTGHYYIRLRGVWPAVKIWFIQNKMHFN